MVFIIIYNNNDIITSKKRLEKFVILSAIFSKTIKIISKLSES